LLKRQVGRRGLLGASAALGLLAQAPSRTLAAPLEQSPEEELRVFDRSPLNAGTPLERLEGLLTPNPLFFIRNHFPVPDIARDTWSLTVDGAVERPLTLSFEALRQLPSLSQTLLIECAGNGRSGFDPRAEGTQWDQSAVGTAEWTGVALADILDRAGLRPEAREIVFHSGDNRAFQRSLTRTHALGPDVVVAYAMNGEPIPPNHGFPVRLVVPGFIGVASVKWLSRIEAVTEPFEGFYQRQRYVLERPDLPTPLPATTLPVRAIIARPLANAVLAAGTHQVSGFAYSGHGRIVSVEVSTDGSNTWSLAYLAEPNLRWGWTRWQLTWTPAPGAYTLMARASRRAGDKQNVR
jgi:DMSO/TMAO reductase YedYZ molybdopterin-dependent catalytic subunit